MAGDIIMGEDDLGPNPSEHPTPQRWLCAKGWLLSRAGYER